MFRIQQVNFKTVDRCFEFFALKSTGRNGSAHQSSSGFFLFTVAPDIPALMAYCGKRISTSRRSLKSCPSKLNVKSTLIEVQEPDTAGGHRRPFVGRKHETVFLGAAGTYGRNYVRRWPGFIEFRWNKGNRSPRIYRGVGRKSELPDD